MASVLNFQKGILFTINELLLRTGNTIKKFVNEDRNGIVKPIGFILLCSLIYTLFQRWLNFEDGYFDFSGLWSDSSVSMVMKWLSNNYGITNIILVNFIALWLKIETC